MINPTRLVCLAASVLLCGQLLSQQNKILLQTDASLDFTDCTDILIDVLDKDDQIINHVDVTNLESAWVHLPDVFPSRTILSENFNRIDDDRFKVSINNPDIDPTSNPIAVLKTYAPGVDPETGDPLDEIVNFPLVYNATTSSFESDYFLLVMDIDQFDDNIEDYSMTPQDSDSGLEYDESTFDGEDDGPDDITIGGEIGGKMKIEYINSGGEILTVVLDVCDESSSEIKEVRLNLISITDENGIPYISNPIIISAVDVAQKIWQQACIKFVDKNGGKLEEEDIIFKEAPETIFDDNTLEGSTIEINQMGMVTRIIPSAEQRELLDEVKDDESLTIDIVFVSHITDPFAPSAVVAGESLYDRYTSEEDIAYTRTCFMTQSYKLLTLAHEIGHVLTDDSHLGYAFEQGDYLPPPLQPGQPDANGVVFRNLMGRATSTNLGIYESKRLLDSQIEWARNNTDLPQ